LKVETHPRVVNQKPCPYKQELSQALWAM
jgi:hypothetical protein